MENESKENYFSKQKKNLILAIMYKFKTFRSLNQMYFSSVLFHFEKFAFYKTFGSNHTRAHLLKPFSYAAIMI